MRQNDHPVLIVCDQDHCNNEKLYETITEAYADGWESRSTHVGDRVYDREFCPTCVALAEVHGIPLAELV